MLQALEHGDLIALAQVIVVELFRRLQHP